MAWKVCGAALAWAVAAVGPSFAQASDLQQIQRELREMRQQYEAQMNALRDGYEQRLQALEQRAAQATQQVTQQAKPAVPPTRTGALSNAFNPAIGVILDGRDEDLVESYLGAGVRTGFGDEWIRVVGIEWCPDCSTSGRTAARLTSNGCTNGRKYRSNRMPSFCTQRLICLVRLSG